MLITRYINEQGGLDKVVLTSEGPEDAKKMAEFDTHGPNNPIPGAHPPVQPDWFSKLKKTA
jgi:hypothetical protein